MDKLERLLNLISALLETSRPLTAEELRERVPGYPEAKASFRRAFERDKEDLREMGVPLVYEPIPGVDPPTDGYRIDRSRYYLRDPGFEPDELAALHLAVSAVRLDGVESEAGLWKLGGVVEAEGEEPALDGALASLPADPNLPGPVPGVRRAAHRRLPLPRRGAHGGSPPGRLPAGQVVPERLGPRPGRRPQVPVGPHQRRGDARPRRGVRGPSDRCVGPAGGAVAARRRRRDHRPPAGRRRLRRHRRAPAGARHAGRAGARRRGASSRWR